MPNVNAISENPIEMLAVVALLRDLPEEGLQRGEAGTVVEHLSPTAVEVEFVDPDGSTRAMVAVEAEDLLVLHLNPVPQAA
jgi:class 3 adenylate cyclase